MTATRSQQLSRAIVGCAAESFGVREIAKAKLCLLDFLGCALESVDLAPSREAVAIASTSRACHIVGSPKSSTAGDAAFANAVMGHGLVREDMHAPSIGHHGVVVWPLLLAASEEDAVSGRRFLVAAIIAYEVGCRLGRMLIDATTASLYRPTGLVAPIGAASGASWMLGLDSDRIASAIALSANTSSGLNQWPDCGGSDMFFHPGFAARNALTAVRLAQSGAFGTPDILEGPSGLFAGFARRPMDGSVQFFPNGECDILNVYHKRAPVCNFAQTSCQVAMRLVEELGEGAAPVSSIRISVPRAAAIYPGCGGVGPFSRPLQAKMSIPYSVAAVFAHRRLSEENYTDLAHPDVVQLVTRTTLEISEPLSAEFPMHQGATVEATLADGRRISLTQRDVISATEADVRERFRAAAEAVLGKRRCEQVEAFIDDLERKQDAGKLAGLCAVQGAAGVAARTARRGALQQIGRPDGLH